jgi:tripeptidyl-peptidase-1
VTAVGGTFQINPEIAIGLSGGGFSRLFPTPAYQTKAVSRYLETLGTKYKGLYKYAIPLGITYLNGH